jgi:uncharacterized membrane protein|tara:strand:+ start:1772 stop:2188 length:417 start_codon:yes stop_codon:yes gene_type:complete
MAKGFIYAIALVFIIEFSLVLFGGQTTTTTKLYDLLADPTTIKSSALYIFILATMTVFGLSPIISGNFWNFNIYALYAGMGVVLITFIMSIAHFYTFIFSQLSSSGIRDFSHPISLLITTPLLLFYLITMTEWVRSNQ